MIDPRVQFLIAVLRDAPILSRYHGPNGFEVERFAAEYEAWMASRRNALKEAATLPADV